MKNSIDKQEFLGRLESCWGNYPNLRFGQFIHNFFAVMATYELEPYLMEDEEFIRLLEWYAKARKE